MSNQGKRKEQREDSYRLAFWSYGGIFLITMIAFLGDGCSQASPESIQAQHNFQVDTITDKQQVIETKEDIDHTGTTHGERTYEEQLSIEPDYIYYDTTGSQKEMDSIDDYMRHWYEVLDTNSDGDIDMDCGGEVHDSIIEWLEE